MLNTDDPKLQKLFDALFENETTVGHTKAFAQEVQNRRRFSAHPGQKFLKLNMGTAGHFMVNRETEMVYSTLGYGQPNLDKPRGNVEFLTQFVKECTRNGQEYIHNYWYDLHEISNDGTFNLQAWGSRSAKAATIRMQSIPPKTS